MKQQHARVITTAFAAGGLVALGTAGAMADPGGGNDNSAEHVTFCHATGTPDDAGNGYVVIPPAKTGALRGHANWDFKNDKLPAEGEDVGHLADIIPPFDYVNATTKETGHFPGQNWDEEGQAIWENDCQEPEPEEPPTEEPPTEEPPTEEPPTEEPPTEEPPTEEPPTEEPPTEEPPTEEPPTDDDEVVPPTGGDDTTPPPAGDAGQPETPVVVQTDGTAAEDNSMLAALGVAILFAGGATAVAVGAGVSGRRH